MGRRLGVFGGTFDPVHVGHLIMATELRYRLGLDHVLFVPAGDPPHKPDLPLTPINDRLRMLEIAIGRSPAFSIDLVDVERAGPSYTKETLALLSRKFPDDELVFLMGEDSLQDLPTWRSPELILQLAEIGVGARPGIDVDLDELFAVLPAARGRVSVVEIPLIGVASRDIRNRVRTGEPISYQVTAGVEQYIIGKGLFLPKSEHEPV